MKITCYKPNALSKDVLSNGVFIGSLKHGGIRDVVT